jgi:hypothetical protein
VRYRPAVDAGDRRRALEAMRQLRFNTVSIVGAKERLSFIDRVLADAPYSGLPDEADHALSVVRVAGDARDITIRAWGALADGARAILFDDWAALQRDRHAQRAAADFAEAVTRNAALYASLVPVRTDDGRRRIQVKDGGDAIDARFLESADALVLIAINRSGTSRGVTCQFSPDVPEAIWRNMFNGGSVTFIAGPDGPTYPRTFAPKEVLVLAISKGLR